MNKERVVIIGGVAAGMSAASRARKLRHDMEILVFEKSGYVSYAACGMPYLISDKVKSVDDLVVYDPLFFKEKRGIDVFLHHEVRQIFPQKKIVLVRNDNTGDETEYSYAGQFMYPRIYVVVPSNTYAPKPSKPPSGSNSGRVFLS